MQFEQSRSEIKWTWADLVSSYRFWALFIFFITVMMVNASLGNVISYLRINYGIPNVIIGTSVSIKLLFTIIAILPAWLVSRTKYYYPLYLFAILMVIGLLLLSFAKDGNNLIFVAMALLGLSIGSVNLLIPAYIARAVNSVEVFILSFGVISITNMLNGTSMTFVMSNLISQAVPFNTIIIFLVILIIIGTLFLLPVKKCLFNEHPRVREVPPETPRNVNALVTLLLFFVPFYFIFWFYRVHKDIRNFSQSATLLTPLGAGLSSIFMPFAMPIMLSILNDVIRQKLLDKGKKGMFKTGLIIAIGLFLPPIAAAMVQSEVNKLASVENNNS
ncbi:MFS transporter [Entomomonas asaccharolytica]|uniref:MFS transporter n=1 Tax=Entomomonas asaccharolytica TaxID=2785331 RepID=A0A974NDM3_9GAMM|nr:hypothetical protein [Entomomonas asaccharolytica]QQP84522.1 hypothetical protein JHT90_08840 [Entomomonas asaccharolytica]